MAAIRIKACCVSMDNENSLQSLALAKKSEFVLPFVGIHPECVYDDLEKMIHLIEEYHTTISGIGEIGLDPTYTKNEDDTKRQKHEYLQGRRYRILCNWQGVVLHTHPLDSFLSPLPFRVSSEVVCSFLNHNLTERSAM